MPIQLVQVDWTGRDSNGDTASLSFDDIQKVSIKKASDVKSSSATITLQNAYATFQTGFDQPFSKYNQDTNQIMFTEGDTIKIYAAQIDSFRALDTSITSDDLLMTGEIAEVNVKGGEKTAQITLKVVDKTYVMLNRIHPHVYSLSDAMNAPEIIQDIIRFITDDVDGDPVSFDDDGNVVDNGKYSVDAQLSIGKIENLRVDGSVFPDLAMAKLVKPAYEWVKELSTIESTNDFDGADDADAPTQNRNMLFYVDESNKFHWYYPRDVASTTLDGAITTTASTITANSVTLSADFVSVGTIFIGTERIDYTGIGASTFTGATRGANNTTAATHADNDLIKNAITITEGDSSGFYTLIKHSLTKKTFDIVNFVIFTAGKDMLGNGITSFFFDRATKSKTLKDTHQSYNDIAEALMLEEIKPTGGGTGRLTEDNTTSSTFNFNGNRYKETTGDYDGGAGITTSWGTVVKSDGAYNKAFRAQCIKEGKKLAQRLTSQLGSPRWKGTMEFKFHRFTPGEVFEFTSTRSGINKQALRIKTVQYNLTKSGAFVTLTVEEDEKKLGET